MKHVELFQNIAVYSKRDIIFAIYFMDRQIRRKLVDLARIRGGRISYQALSDEFQLHLDMKTKGDRQTISRLLAEISAFEYEGGRPLLSALVLKKGKPGKQLDDYFKSCEELGMGNWEELRSNPDFEREQREACYAFWRQDANYKDHKYVS